MLGKKFQDFSN